MFLRAIVLHILFGSAVANACETTHLDTLSSALSLDSTAVMEMRKQAIAELKCLDRAARPEQALALHHVNALYHLALGDEAEVARSLDAAVAIDPTYPFPDKFEQTQLPFLHQEAVRSADVDTIDFDAPDEHDAYIDGQLASSRPVNTPMLFQWIGPRTTTQYLQANAALPKLAPVVQPPTPVAPAPEPAPVVVRKGPRAPLLFVGGALVAAGAGLGVASAVQHDKVRNNTRPDVCPCPDWESKVRSGAVQTNVLGGSGLALTGIGLVVGVSGLL